MNTQNIKLTFRNLQRNKLYSFLSITGFAVGFAVCIISALYIYHEFTMDQCFPDYKRIVRVIDTKNKNCNLDYKLNEDFKERYPEVEAACPIELESGWDIKVRTETTFRKFQGMISTTNDFFRLFPVKILKSSGREPFTGNESVIVTRSMAKLLFKDEDPIGKYIEITDILKGQVSAEIEDFPAASSIHGNVLINAVNEKLRLNQNCNNGVCVNPTNHFLLLRQGADLTRLKSNLNRNTLKSHPEIGKLSLEKISDIYLEPPLDGSNIIAGNKSLLWIFLSVGLIVLILSIINFLNFYLSMQYTKLKEIGIKKINGAGYGQLLSYSFLEVTISILISVLLAIFIVALILPFVSQLFEKQLEIKTLLIPQLTLVLLAVLLLILILNSFAPIFILAKFNTSSFLGTIKTGSRKQIGRKLFTLVQFTASMVLIAIVIALYQQISYTKNADLGFKKENLVRLNMPYSFRNLEALKQQLSQLSFCQSISFSSGSPGSIHLRMGEVVNKKQVELSCIEADNNFLNTMGIKMKAGRDFLDSDIDNACIINEEAMRQYGWSDLTDKRFKNGKEGGYPVIGVMQDFHITSLHAKIEPVCLMFRDMHKISNSLEVSIRLTPGDIHQEMLQLEKVWKSLIPDEPMDYTFYDEDFRAMYKKDEQLSKVIAIVAIITLILTFMGILGQSFQISLNRTKEIGIRKVNGATVFEILASLNKEYAGWLLAALVIAIPVSYYFIHKWLENFAYKTSISWWFFALSGIIVFVTVIVTVGLQSWKTATRNPVEALRYE